MQNQISEDVKDAMRAGDKPRLETLRMLKTALQMAAIDAKGDLSEEAAIKVLQKQAKQRLESAEMFRKGGNNEQAEKELAEHEIIQSYLPKPLDEAELIALVEQEIANGNDQMGQIISAVLEKSEGRADGAAVSKIVRDKLS